MDYPNGKTGYARKAADDGEPAVSLKDVPRAVRRQEAGKPLYLNRYE